MTIRALNSYVFCRVPEDAETRVTAGGLFIPQTASGRPDRAVVEVAPRNSDVQPGDRVGFDPYRIEVVFGPGQLAQAQRSPIANPGELFVIREDHVLFVEDREESGSVGHESV